MSQELIARIEAASGPDREIDRDIFSAVFPELVPSPIVTSGYGWRQDRGGWWLATGEDSRTPPKTIYPLRFSASIDAALTLMPDWHVRQMHFNAPSADDRKWSVQLRGGKEGEKWVSAFAATPALALCAAALKARLA